jgi:hypothetical protein
VDSSGTPGDLLGRQATQLAQCHRHLGIGRQRGVAARKDRSEPIVHDIVSKVDGSGAA